MDKLVRLADQTPTHIIIDQLKSLDLTLELDHLLRFYDDYLAKIDDQDIRAHLSKLTPVQARNDEIFMWFKNQGRMLQDVLGEQDLERAAGISAAVQTIAVGSTADWGSVSEGPRDLGLSTAVATDVTGFVAGRLVPALQAWFPTASRSHAERLHHSVLREKITVVPSVPWTRAYHSALGGGGKISVCGSFPTLARVLRCLERRPFGRMGARQRESE